METISAAAARRIALAAQGFATPRPARRGGIAAVRGVVSRLRLLQIDSVAAVARSHYLPLQARLGDYDTSALDDLAYRRRELFETWAHEASLVPVALHPLLRWRMDPAPRPGRKDWFAHWAIEKRDFVETVHDRIARDGPLPAEALGERRRGGSWWSWSDAKLAAEWLFRTGRVAVASRPNFVRHYDVADRVLPADVLAAPTPSHEDAHRELLAASVAALGVATTRDAADYFRIAPRAAAPRLAELAAAGRIAPVRVDGWDEPAWIDPSARRPRTVAARAILSPFDPLVFERRRTERIFGMRYRLEMYTPEPRRVFGYYVMPFLLGDDLPARIDVRADRGAGVLRVPAAHLEPERRADDVARPLADEFRTLASWLGLPKIEVGRRGDLARALRRCVP